MTIGIVSDTHRNTARPRAALDTFRERGIQTVFHLGDIGGAKVINLFRGFNAYFVYGNADRNMEELTREIEAGIGAGRLAEWHDFEFEGIRLAFCHGHTRTLDDLIADGTYDIVLHGHTHKRRDETVGSTRVINPGALGGIKWQSRSFATLELPSGAIEWIELQ